MQGTIKARLSLEMLFTYLTASTLLLASDLSSLHLYHPSNQRLDREHSSLISTVRS